VVVKSERNTPTRSALGKGTFQNLREAKGTFARSDPCKIRALAKCDSWAASLRHELVPLQAAASTEAGCGGSILPLRSAAVASTGGKGLEK
jgi:hypothetical protein